MSKRMYLLESADEFEILKLKRPPYNKWGRMVILYRRETLQHRSALWGKLRCS